LAEMQDNADVGQAFQPAFFRANPVAGWKACPTRLKAYAGSLFLLDLCCTRGLCEIIGWEKYAATDN
jgi:hypothetical protein